MTNDTILVLGGTGKTGGRLATLLRAAGADVRTAARHGADVVFDWDDPATHDPALRGAGAVYLIPPPSRLDVRDPVATFLDRAEAAGVRHVTHLSSRDADQAPALAQLRAVELGLAARTGLTSSTLRPAWFMQNFEGPYLPRGGVLAAPAGDGGEAFIHAGDIAEVAAATLLAPADHAGAAYTLTGPAALTFADVADHIARATGHPVRYDDVAPDAWAASLAAAGVPEEIAAMLTGLMAGLRAHAGATPTDDVERVTGHPPRSFGDYAREPEARATWSGTSA